MINQLVTPVILCGGACTRSCHAKRCQSVSCRWLAIRIVLSCLTGSIFYQVDVDDW